MNNIYVDELPKKGACFNGCPYAVCDTWVYYCPFQQDDNEDHLIVEEDCIKACPLKLVTDRLAEERNKVVQEIREHFKNNLFDWYDDEDNANKELYLDADCVWRILDQIEKGDNL